MGFLEDLVVPPTSEHVVLLDIFQVLSLLIFLPFIGMVIGGTFYSLFFSSIRDRNLNYYFRFANDVIKKLAVNIYVGLGLCIIPFFTIVFIYAQLLYGVDNASVDFLELSAILYLAGLILVYIYKRTITYVNIVESYRFNKKSIGWMGLLLLIIASFLFVGSVTLANDPQNSLNVKSVIGLLTSGTVWLNFIYFISSSFTITAAAVLYLFFIWRGGIRNSTLAENDTESGYFIFVRKFAVGLALISSIVQLLILFLSLIVLPQNAFTGSLFLYTALAIVSIFFTTIFLYAILKNAEIKYAGVVFFLVFLTFTFTIIKDQLAFGNMNKEQLLVSNSKAEELIKEKYPQLEKKEVAGVVNAEEIFNTRCLACHKFDVKLVGPPYNETIPKYNGDADKLAKFILNPVKVNPDYPDMPNQGLKKEEADALAKFLIENVKTK